MADEDGFESWAIVELMGHVKMAGRLTEEERFGSKLGRLDIPTQGGYSTVYFNGSSVYRISPCTEEVARVVAVRNQPEPVHPWEMPKQLETARSRETYDEPDDPGDDDDYDPDGE